MFLGAVLQSKLLSYVSDFDDKDMPSHPLFETLISEPGKILESNKTVVELVDSDSPIVSSFVKVRIWQYIRKILAKLF